MSLIKKILLIKEKKPVTKEELEQLELEAQKQELKARIARSKSMQFDAKLKKFESFGKTFGGSNVFPKQKNTKEITF